MHNTATNRAVDVKIKTNATEEPGELLIVFSIAHSRTEPNTVAC